MSGFIAPLLAGLLFICIPVFVVFTVIKHLRINRKRSREQKIIPPNWHLAKGRIIATSIEEAVRTRVEDDEFYYPSVRFEYTDGLQVYNAGRAVGRPYNTKSIARQVLENYPIGGEIIVYYNPQKPDEARLLVK